MKSRIVTATKAETTRLLKERDWWKTLAEAYGMRLYGFNGMPPSDGSFITPDYNRVVEIQGPLASAMFKMAQKAGVIPQD